MLPEGVHVLLQLAVGLAHRYTYQVLTEKGKLMKIVVIVKNGVVAQVLTDNTEIRVIVLDHDTEGCDESSIIDVGQEDVGIDAIHQGLAKYAPAEVASIFGEVQAELQELGGNEKASDLVVDLFTA